MCKFELLSLEFACIASKNWTAKRTGGFIQGRKKKKRGAILLWAI
jgi:hypothetical protein